MNPFMEMHASLEQMIETKKIDVSINENFMDLSETIGAMKNTVLEIDVGSEESFPLFFSLDTQQKILRRMIERINDAEIKMENPKVARQIIAIIPLMSNIFSLVSESIKKNKNYLGDKIVKLSIDLENLALDQDLFMKKEDSISKIRKMHIKTLVKDFASEAGGVFE
ncbi:MAG: hypothetical protein KAS32_18505 [Candidatus Peribacteraceae bacterium]|nr:hypothetical protein [Candidatus Peribacteraceae bacterium]